MERAGGEVTHQYQLGDGEGRGRGLQGWGWCVSRSRPRPRAPSSSTLSLSLSPPLSLSPFSPSPSFSLPLSPRSLPLHISRTHPASRSFFRHSLPLYPLSLPPSLSPLSPSLTHLSPSLTRPRVPSSGTLSLCILSLSLPLCPLCLPRSPISLPHSPGLAFLLQARALGEELGKSQEHVEKEDEGGAEKKIAGHIHDACFIQPWVRGGRCVGGGRWGGNMVCWMRPAPLSRRLNPPSVAGI